jgi:hypothetical protein
VLRRLFGRGHQDDVRIPDRVFAAVASDGSGDLLAYVPPGERGAWFAGFTTREALAEYWRERTVDFATREIDTIELFGIVAVEADGLTIDPMADDAVFLASADVRRWLNEPRVELSD